MSLYLWFALMLAVSVLWLVWFLYRPLQTNNLNLEKSNIALGKQKQAELEQDLQSDLIDKQIFEQAKDEIAQTLSVEITQTNRVINNNQQNTTIGLAVLIAVFFCVISVLMYQALSSHSIIAHTHKSLTLEESIAKIKRRVTEQPDDKKAWRMLGLAWFKAGENKHSLAAYERAYQLDKKNVGLLVEYASTLAITQGYQFTGRVSDLVREALEIDANSPDALHLAGWIAVNAQQFDLAQKLWQKTLSVLPSGSIEKAQLQRRLAELSQIQTSVNALTTDEVKQKYQVKVEITLSERLRQAQYQNHYLMVYVKATQGRSMPIAIQKMKLKDFEGVVILTDEHSTMPSKTLSQSSKVLAVARLSQSGAAMRQADDIEVVSQPIDIKDNPTIKLKL